MRTLTLICPDNLRDKASHWITCVFDLHLADLTTFNASRYIEPPSQKRFGISSGRYTDEQVARALQSTALQRPSVDASDNPQVDLTKANGARQEITVWEPSYDEDGAVTNAGDLVGQKIVLVLDMQASEVIQLSGLSLIEDEA